MRFRLISITTLLVFATIISSCGSMPGDGTASTGDSTNRREAIDFFGADGCNYIIIRSDSASNEEIKVANYLNDEISRVVGTYIALYTDGETGGQPGKKGKYEILLGKTVYTESGGIYDSLQYGEYVVTFVGEKIIIAGWNEEGLQMAAIEFIGMLKDNLKSNQEGQKTVVIPADSGAEGFFSPVAENIPPYEGGDIAGVYKSTGGSYVVLITGTDIAEFDRYINSLSEYGFCEYTHNKIADNSFYTYVNDKYCITAYYTPHNTSVRITAEPLTALPELAEENIYKKIVGTELYQLGLEFTEASGKTTINGLSHVIRLHDGSFIVIDGGFNRDRDATLLYNVLKDNAPDKDNIVIAAWLITHAHGDHAGCFLKFANTYSGNVTVEKIIYNLPLESESAPVLDNGYISTIQGLTYRFTGANQIIAHTGQKFYIRNAVIEILYTFDDFRPNKFTTFNISSLVFSLEIEGQRIMYLGDSYTTTSKLLCNMYGNSLKSDFVQVAHHGDIGGTAELYENIKPNIVLWPAAWSTYEKFKTKKENAYLLNLSTVEKVFVAGADVTTIPLPFPISK